MIRKIACILAILGPLTASAQAQESVPKPTKADAAKVVKIITARNLLQAKSTRPGAPRITARSSGSASRPTTWERPWGQNSSG
jgi:hypothetical protein